MYIDILSKNTNSLNNKLQLKWHKSIPKLYPGELNINTYPYAPLSTRALKNTKNCCIKTCYSIYRRKRLCKQLCLYHHMYTVQKNSYTSRVILPPFLNI